MAAIKIKSLREPALESVELFLHREGFGELIPLRDGVIHILDRVAGYREEGVRLFPEILITADLEGITRTVQKPLVVTVGVEKADARVFKLALKSCAPLARDGWCVFVEIGEELFRYGVMTAIAPIAALSMSAQLLNSFDKLPVKSFMLRAVSDSRARLIGRKETVELRFTLEEDESDDRIAIEAFARCATSTLILADRDIVHGNVSNMLQQALEESHGSLVAAVDPSEAAIKAVLQNASRFALLREPINLQSQILDAHAQDSRELHLALASYSGLIRRMVGHDGISIITSNAELIAYNVIIKNDPQAVAPEVGGARTRAFSTLQTIEGVASALFRSQDGATAVWHREQK